MIPITIPPESVDFINDPEALFEGKDTLKYEVPWQVAGSIFKEAESMDGSDVVLEVGSGGSTLFLARRCNRVFAVDTNKEWITAVYEKSLRSGIKNITCFTISNEDRLCEFLSTVDMTNVTVVSVDTQGGYNRSRIMNTILDKEAPNLRMIIQDNYSHEGLYPLHHDKLIKDDPEWEVFTYDMDMYAGNGTRLYIKKQK